MAAPPVAARPVALKEALTLCPIKRTVPVPPVQDKPFWVLFDMEELATSICTCPVEAAILARMPLVLLSKLELVTDTNAPPVPVGTTERPAPVAEPLCTTRVLLITMRGVPELGATLMPFSTPLVLDEYVFQRKRRAGYETDSMLAGSGACAVD